MKLLIFGNVGSGKSTLIVKINSVVRWDVIAIDDFRRKYGNGSKKGELIARNKFSVAIKPEINQIIECTGVGQVGEELFWRLRQWNEKIIMVLLKVPQTIAKYRLQDRIWDIPFPNPLDEVESFIYRSAIKLEFKTMDAAWNSIPNIEIIERENLNFQSMDSISDEVIKLLQPYF